MLAGVKDTPREYPRQATLQRIVEEALAAHLPDDLELASSQVTQANAGRKRARALAGLLVAVLLAVGGFFGRGCWDESAGRDRLLHSMDRDLETVKALVCRMNDALNEIWVHQMGAAARPVPCPFAPDAVSQPTGR